MIKINLTITVGELQILNKALNVILAKKEPLAKALNSILYKLSEKVRKRVLAKFNHQDTDDTKFTFEYYEGYALYDFLSDVNFDFEAYPYESNVLMKIKDALHQQL